MGTQPSPTWCCPEGTHEKSSPSMEGGGKYGVAEGDAWLCWGFGGTGTCCPLSSCHPSAPFSPISIGTTFWAMVGSFLFFFLLLLQIYNYMAGAGKSQLFSPRRYFGCAAFGFCLCHQARPVGTPALEGDISSPCTLTEGRAPIWGFGEAHCSRGDGWLLLIITSGYWLLGGLVMRGSSHPCANGGIGSGSGPGERRLALGWPDSWGCFTHAGVHGEMQEAGLHHHYACKHMAELYTRTALQFWAACLHPACMELQAWAFPCRIPQSQSILLAPPALFQAVITCLQSSCLGNVPQSMSFQSVAAGDVTGWQL